MCDEAGGVLIEIGAKDEMISQQSKKELDEQIKKQVPFARAIHRATVTEMKYEFLCSWMQDNAPEALRAHLEETADFGYDLRLAYQKKLQQVSLECGGNDVENWLLSHKK